MKKKNNEYGGAMLMVLFLTGIIALAAASSLTSASNIINSTKNNKSQTEDYYSVESSFNQVLNWLRENSTNLIGTTKLVRSDFYSTYDISSPSIASNDSSAFAEPSLLRINGTSNVPLITNDNSLGTSSYPIVLLMQ